MRRNNLYNPSPKTHQVLVNNVKISNTGSTTENTIYTGTIHANSIGVNGSFHIIGLWSVSNNANAKDIKVKFNGTTVLDILALTSVAATHSYTILTNRNSLSAQVSGNVSSPAANAGFGTNSGSAVSTYTINTGADITVTVTMTNGNGTDTVSLEAFQILAVN